MEGSTEEPAADPAATADGPTVPTAPAPRSGGQTTPARPPARKKTADPSVAPVAKPTPKRAAGAQPQPEDSASARKPARKTAATQKRASPSLTAKAATSARAKKPPATAPAPSVDPAPPVAAVHEPMELAAMHTSEPSTEKPKKARGVAAGGNGVGRGVTGRTTSAEAGLPKPTPPARRPVRAKQLPLAAAGIPDATHIDEALIEVALASAEHFQVVVVPDDVVVVPDEVVVVPDEHVATNGRVAPDASASLQRVRPVRKRNDVTRPIPLWARLAADPGFAAEHAAREMVDRLGPSVRDWLRRASHRYPTASPDGLARLAVMDAVRLARRQGVASGAGGVLGTTTAGALLVHSHARLVLTIAAAYGFDPTARERAHDLLVVLRVPRLTQPAPAALRNAGRFVASFAVRRAAAHLMPFGAAIAGATIGARGTRAVADRATAHFRRAAERLRSS